MYIGMAEGIGTGYCERCCSRVLGRRCLAQCQRSRSALTLRRALTYSQQLPGRGLRVLGSSKAIVVRKWGSPRRLTSSRLESRTARQTFCPASSCSAATTAGQPSDTQCMTLSCAPTCVHMVTSHCCPPAPSTASRPARSPPAVTSAPGSFTLGRFPAVPLSTDPGNKTYRESKPEPRQSSYIFRNRIIGTLDRLPGQFYRLIDWHAPDLPTALRRQQGGRRALERPDALSGPGFWDATVPWDSGCHLFIAALIYGRSMENQCSLYTRSLRDKCPIHMCSLACTHEPEAYAMMRKACSPNL